mgnify:CR=1 FL=1
MSTEPTFNILVLNCGSSSFKFALIDISTGDEQINGLAEKLGQSDAVITIKYNNEKKSTLLGNDNKHKDAIKVLVEELQQRQLSASVKAIGHRVVHGGEAFTASVLIDDEVMAAINEVSSLAPLHNPANVVGIHAARDAFPELPQIAVFDTAFHQSMPAKAFMYAIDSDLYKTNRIRRYGFHGTSHYYVLTQTAQRLNKSLDTTSVITAHLGNGCSVTAIENGQSVDTSMGMTPLEGLVMGTRSGDIDPGVIIHLMNHLQYSAKDIDQLLNKQSGLLGLSQTSNDCRKLEEMIVNQDNEFSTEQQQSATLALEVFCYRVAKYIGAYSAALSHLDALVFTGGIGENSSYIRGNIVRQLSILGFQIDSDKNIATRFGASGEIQNEQARAPIYVIPTNEEWVIATDAAKIAKGDI